MPANLKVAVIMKIGPPLCALGFFCGSLVRSSAPASPRETVRAELVRLQAQDGLTLASFYRGIETVKFADRSQVQSKDSFGGAGGTAGLGAISRDGAEIAFDFHSRFGDSHLAITQLDGGAFREFSTLTSASGICWSYAQSRLVTTIQIRATQDKPLSMRLVVLTPDTKETNEISDGAYATSQCWSPGNNEIVYEADDGIRVYDLGRKESRFLAKGRYPTWSSDGRWLSFLDGDTYFAISPSGEGRKVLFKEKGGLSGLWWSPDSRIVAYLSRNGAFEGSPKTVDVGLVRLRVRRLDDNSEDWVAQLSDAYLPSYQWVTNSHFR
jgi:hypothetical protein